MGELEFFQFPLLLSARENIRHQIVTDVEM